MSKFKDPLAPLERLLFALEWGKLYVCIKAKGEKEPLITGRECWSLHGYNVKELVAHPGLKAVLTRNWDIEIHAFEDGNAKRTRLLDGHPQLKEGLSGTRP